LSDDFETDALTKSILQIVRERKPRDVNELVLLVRERFQLTENQVLEKILTLERQGKIKFEAQSPTPPLALSSYLETGQALWYWAIIAVATLTLVAVFLIPEDLQPWSYLRNVLGTIFVLLMPGYALIKALFPVNMPIKMSTESLDIAERIALSLGMSLVLVPLVGLLLNYTLLGIRLVPTVLSLFVLTVVFSTFAVFREHQAKIKTQR
jgi:Protein of unknown function (DUF1616)